MKTNRIIATLLCFILLFSAASVSAETTEYALSDSTKVRLLGRGASCVCCGGIGK